MRLPMIAPGTWCGSSESTSALMPMVNVLGPLWAASGIPLTTSANRKTIKRLLTFFNMRSLLLL